MILLLGLGWVVGLLGVDQKPDLLMTIGIGLAVLFLGLS